MSILTHDRIKINGATKGPFAPAKGLLWGQNAIQSITIGRHTPKTPYQAVGLLGIVDYGSGAITSDVAIETFLAEGCDKADTVGKLNSIYRYAKQSVTLGVESYVLTGFNIAMQAGQTITVGYNWITSSFASYLEVQDQPTEVGIGEESNFAIVMGDDGSGIKLLATWDTVTARSGFVPILDANGVLQAAQLGDEGVPAGAQTCNFSGTINRDQVLDIRTAQPVQFVTTYPLDITAELRVFELAVKDGALRPGEPSYDPDDANNKPIWDKLQDIALVATALAKHRSSYPGGWTPPDTAAADDVYVKAIGLTKIDESQAVSVGQYLSFTANFRVSDLILPLPQIA